MSFPYSVLNRRISDTVCGAIYPVTLLRFIRRKSSPETN